jgi:hypothetical protein
MPIDPRFFLGLTGPVPAQAPLPPGFRPPGPGGGAPMAQPQAMGGAVPGMGGLGALAKIAPGQEPQRTAGDADLGGYSGAKPGGMFQLPDGTWAQNPNEPASYQGQGASGGGGFLDWLSNLKTRLF